MILTRKHIIDQGKYKAIKFTSPSGYHAFTNEQAKQLDAWNKRIWENTYRKTKGHIQRKSDWYGTPIPKSLDELELHTQFAGLELLKKIRPKIKNKLDPYFKLLSLQEVPKPQLAYNSMGMGIFSFDRAAMGLKKSYPINLNTPLDRLKTQLGIELGQQKTTSSIEECFAYYKNKASYLPSLNLYIMAGANFHVDGNDLLYPGLAASELVQFLESRGVPVKVSVLIGSAFNEQIFMQEILVKPYTSSINVNTLLLLASDPRFFRYRGFKSLITLANYMGAEIPDGLGTLLPFMGKNYVKQIDPDGIVFEQSYSLAQAVKEVEKVIKWYTKRRNKK